MSVTVHNALGIALHMTQMPIIANLIPYQLSMNPQSQHLTALPVTNNLLANRRK